MLTYAYTLLCTSMLAAYLYKNMCMLGSLFPETDYTIVSSRPGRLYWASD